MSTRRISRCPLMLFAVAAWLGAGSLAHALTKEVVDEKVVTDAQKEEPKAGWTGKLTLAANISLSSASNVVGTQDGVTFTLGLALNGQLDYGKGPHEWRNRLELAEAWSKVPNIDRFVKSIDYLTFDSIYLYHFESLDWIGPFVRLGLRTTLLPGYDIRPTEFTYETTRLDGTVDIDPNTDTKRLTDSFLPFMLKESLGAYMRPVQEKFAALEVRLGLGAQEVFAADQLAVTGADTKTSIIKVKELEDYAQVGGELVVTFNGAVYEDKVLYKVYAEAMMPFYNSGSNPDGKTLPELTNLDLGAGLAFKLFSWASLVYEFKALRLPQIVDEFQIQNTLVLSFNYSLTMDGTGAGKK